MKNQFNKDMQSIVFHQGACGFTISVLALINPIVLLVLLPLLDLLVIPFLRHIMLHPSILKRLGIGSLFILLSTLSLLMLEGIQDQVFTVESSGACVLSQHVEVEEGSAMSSYWLILPEFLITLAEIFIFIPGEYRFKCNGVYILIQLLDQPDLFTSLYIHRFRVYLCSSPLQHEVVSYWNLLLHPKTGFSHSNALPVSLCQNTRQTKCTLPSSSRVYVCLLVLPLHVNPGCHCSGPLFSGSLQVQKT